MSASGARFTFRANKHLGRHGWLRLTPAYSVGFVQELVGELGPHDRVLDPFCGAGTTALVCAERGLTCDTVDVNPFLVWLTRVKCATYRAADIDEARALIETAALAPVCDDDWTPPMYKIERWWDGPALRGLAAAWRSIEGEEQGKEAKELARIAFCRAMIAVSRASFRHQSMSLQHDISQPITTAESVAHSLRVAIAVVAESAMGGPSGPVQVCRADSRRLDLISELGRYSAVITSPPYPNRMSYVRELRPYMYWLRFLSDGRAAGELDWEAIGGTWGIATSNLTRWKGEGIAASVIDESVLDAIGLKSQPLSTYIRKYVEDMSTHIASLRSVVAPGGRVTYVIGNSLFYGIPIEAQQIFAGLFHRSGFVNITISQLRKRTSKTGLFEFAVTAHAPD